MTPTSLRIRLALALGLPLAPACKGSTCAPDHIHEHGWVPLGHRLA